MFTFFVYITNIFSPLSIIIVCVFLLVYILIYAYTKRLSFLGVFDRKVFALFPDRVHALIMICKSTVLAAVINAVLKHIYKIPRPIDMRIAETGYSFPSGHAAVAFAFFTAIAVVIHIYKKRKVGYWLLLIPILVSISRVYLHVHRYIDVFVGASIGVLSVVCVIKIYTWYTKKSTQI